VESVERAGPEVTSALIVERGEGFQLDASLLRSLAGRGVPGDVLDMMVAVTYPDRFQIAGSAEDAVAQMRLPSVPVRPAERAVAPWPDRGRAFLGYSPWRFGSFDPFWSDPYFYFSASRFGYGTGPYGYRQFGSPYYQVPRVIVLPPPTVEDRGATLDRNRGLVSNRGGSSGSGGAPSSAAPSSRSGSQGAARAPSGSDARSAPRDSDSGGGSSSPEVRRAVPRSGDGGGR
jgi:hypothetical protein